MAVLVVARRLNDRVDGHMVYSDRLCAWVAVVDPDLTPDARDQTLRALCAQAGEKMDGLIRLAS